MATKAAGPMLNAGIHRAYLAGTQRLASLDGVQPVARGHAAVGDACAARAVVHQMTAANLLDTPTLEDEVFGPSSLLVGCDDLAQMSDAAEHLDS